MRFYYTIMLCAAFYTLCYYTIMGFLHYVMQLLRYTVFHHYVIFRPYAVQTTLTTT